MGVSGKPLVGGTPLLSVQFLLPLFGVVFLGIVSNPEPWGLSRHSERPQAQMAAEAEAAVLGQRRAAVETTLRETQEENDEFRRRILGLEQQLKEARGLAEGGEVAEARLRDKVQRLEVSAPGDLVGFFGILSLLVPG